MHAVTSLAPNLWPDGIWIKKYLEYIEEHGRVNRLAKAEQHFDSHFEEEVYDYLMQKLDLSEYRVSTQVESCGFKIDQVITNVKTSKKLAIECDGPTHFDDGDGKVRVDSDFERQFVLETAHWIFYRISYIDWQQRQKSAKKDLIDAIIDHFSTREKPKSSETTTTTTDLEEVKYEAISVEIPESIITEQKARTVTAPTRGYFGRQVAAKKPDESGIAKDQGELFAKTAEIPTAVTSSEGKMASDHKIHTDKSATSSEDSFSQIGEVQLGSRRSIVISSRGGDSYWFNEKVNDPNYSGFTQKGFGLKANDWSDFRAALARACLKKI